jgi:hypothetical protein
MLGRALDRREMSFGTVLVTVVHGRRRRDLAVRADVPIADLLGPLAEALADHAAPEAGRRVRPIAATLAPVCGRPLPAERSLEACGVGHGAVLVLIEPRLG